MPNNGLIQYELTGSTYSDESTVDFPGGTKVVTVQVTNGTAIYSISTRSDRVRGSHYSQESALLPGFWTFVKGEDFDTLCDSIRLRNHIEGQPATVTVGGQAR